MPCTLGLSGQALPKAESLYAKAVALSYEVCCSALCCMYVGGTPSCIHVWVCLSAVCCMYVGGTPSCIHVRVCHSAICCMYVGGTPSRIYVLWVDLAGLHAEPCGGSGPCTTTNPLFHMPGWKP